MSVQGAMEKKRKLTIEDLIGDSVIVTKDVKKETPDDIVVEEKTQLYDVVDERMVKASKRRKLFISIKEFDQLAQKPPMTWTSLKRDCIYKLGDLDKLDEHGVATLTDHQGRPYRVFIPTVILQMLFDKLVSESSRDKSVEVYLRPKKDEQADIAIKETFPCKKYCNKEFHSNTGRWAHHKHCMKT